MQRVASVTRCSAGKGFGDAAQPRKPSTKGSKQAKSAGVKSGDSKAVQRAVQLVEEEEARAGPGARPIDPREAARGKVEYVRVKDWGSGTPEDLGSLQVDSQATQTFAAGADGGGGGMPFHEALARRLQLLQSQGALSVAQPPGAKPLPPFERWAFAEQHYLQYLADMHAVHAALEVGVAQAAAALQQAAPAADGGGAQRSTLLQALQLFDPEQGLDRAAKLLQDMHRIAARSQQQPSSSTSTESSSDGSGGGASASAPPVPTQHAAAYAGYIASLARLCGAADGVEEEEQAVLRLLAHAYIVHLMHLTSGGRVAAAAGGKLDLAAAGALAFHEEYPELAAGAAPLDLLVGNMNELGRLLSGEQQEALMQELPKAMTKGSMLLTPLARDS